MIDPGMKNAVRALGPDDIAAIERFVARLQREGWIRPEAAHRWQAVLDRGPKRLSPARHAPAEA